MPLAAVLFDVDDTLFSTTAFARSAREGAIRAMIGEGLRVDETVALRELDEVVAEFSSNYGHHYDRLLQRLGPDATRGRNPALILAAGVVAYHNAKVKLRPFDDVIPLLDDLRSAGVRTGVVTHGWTMKQAEKLVRLRLVPHLDPDAIFISDQVGISKPNPKLYQTALRALGLTPGEVMYVGDSPEHDIAPPASLGMVTAWARRAAKRDLTGTEIIPDHVIDDFDQLRLVLRERYGVDLPER